MKLSILAARDDQAQARILDAAAVLAERFGLSDELAALHGAAYPKDRAVEAMQQREAVAGLLEAIIASTEPTKGKGK